VGNQLLRHAQPFGKLCLPAMLGVTPSGQIHDYLLKLFKGHDKMYASRAEIF
jgi:hypothetical protein